ncbi:MAG: cytochrome c biogenesis protein CcdA [Saprospiraceae bacterium]
MRLLIILATLLSATLSLTGQIANPVKWNMHIEKVSTDEFDLIFTANMDPGWMLYSQHTEDGGPIPTTFYFEEGSHYKAIGAVKEEGKKKEGRDPLFDNIMVIKFPKGPVVFTQRVKAVDLTQPITGEVEYMSCNEETCTPPMLKDFSFDLTSVSSTGAASVAESASPAERQAAPEPETKPSSIFADAAKADDRGQDVILDDKVEEITIAPPAGGGMLTPVHWTFSSKALGAGEYEFVATANMDKDWTIPSLHTDPTDGPLPTEFVFSLEGSGITLLGEMQEAGNKKEGPDPVFGGSIVIKFVEGPVVFTQKIKADSPNPSLTGYVTFMTCDNEQCLPPTDVEFSLDLTTGTRSQTGVSAIVTNGTQLDQTRESLQSSYKAPLGNCGEDEVTSDSLVWTFVLGILGGLVALLTPCVFPMIPLTVTFFTKTSKDRVSSLRNAIIYGLSIIAIYVSIGLIITALMGPGALNALSTNWIANVLFFLIFIVFAFSFFGYYEITLPSTWSTKSDAMADKGGLIGIFFMAFTLALVSFSCTGPIIGSALVESATNKMGPFVVMLGFSTALALPFGLFAAFPGWLNSLPRSGSWMTAVKVVLGFLELALALKFLSVADMTMHWGILPYEIFMGLWVVIFSAMALYLLGFIRFPHDSKLKKISIPRWGFTLASLAAVAYLISGFGFNPKTEAYQSLKLMSGLAPPAHYNIFLPKPTLDPELKARFSSYTKCANNLECFKDYYEGLTYAKEVNKPILLDFTGYGCVNCRKTEEHIWVRDQIRERISQDYVLVSLYVDDREPLDEVLVSKVSNGKLRNVGHKWTDFQVVNFKQNTQPLYVLVSPGEQVLAAPRGYKESVNDYRDFLDCGLNTFQRTNALGSK